MAVDVGGRGAGLAAAYGDQIISRRDHPVSGVIYIAQIARGERQLYLSRFAALQMYAREATQSLQGSPRHFRESDVELHDFIAIPLARVLQVDVNIDGASGL